MKIISKFVDYYDHIGKIFGIDDKIVFKRENYSEAGNDINIISRNTVTNLCKIKWQYSRYISNNIPMVKFSVLLVGDLTYVRMIECVDYVTYANRTIKMYEFNEENFIELLTLGFIDRYHKPSYNEVKQWLEELKKFQLHFKTPVLEINQFNRLYYAEDYTIRYTHSPLLKDYGLQKLLPAEQAFQVIQQYIANELMPEPAIEKITDIVKIEQYGFDKKISFRKRK